MKAIYLLALPCSLFTNALFSQSNFNQSLSVNSTGAAADASAQLDVSANNKGVLVPRMTSLERTAIATPATGLLVFDTNTNTFWFFNGTGWINIAPQTMLTDVDNDTKVQVEESPDEDVIRFDLGGTENMVLRRNTSGIPRLELDDALNNLFIGKDAGTTTSTGVQNVAIGKSALFSNTGGNHNTAVGFEALYANTAGNNNTALGRRAMVNNTSGTNNTAIGFRALNSNTAGDYNTATGVDALFNNTEGLYNVANGFGTMASNTIGDYNTALGYKAMNENTTGLFNTASGYQALYFNTFGEGNTANGAYALYSNTFADYNTANGGYALYSNTTGASNSAHGYSALYSNTTGYRNTAIGLSAGSLNDNNIHCTFIGYDADQTVLTDFDNSTALGSFARITASNQVRIGNSNITSIGGYESWTNLSDGRYKRNLMEDVPGLSFILALRPVSYNLDAHALAAHLKEDRIENVDSAAAGQPDAATLRARDAKSRIRYTGFVAQEVEQAAQAIGYDFSGVDKPQNEASLYGLRYAQFVVPLVKAVQEQHVIIEKQQAEIDRLKKVETQLANITAALAGAGIVVEK